MKTYIKLLIPVLLVVFSACEGPRGPVGPQGPAGPEGGLVYAQVFETAPTSFFEQDGWSAVFNVPESIEVFESDVFAAYILWTSDGVDIWRPMPQFVFETDPNFVYNFDYTMDDVRFFLDSENLADLNNLSSDYLDNQVFRVVVIPAEFASARMDLTNYEEVINTLGIDDSNVIKVIKK